MDTLTVQEASEFTGLSAHTLRYYERIGLIEPVTRNAGGHRRYVQTDLEHLRFLHCLRDTGMPIQRMQEYAALASQGRVTLNARLELVNRIGAMSRCGSRSWRTSWRSLTPRSNVSARMDESQSAIYANQIPWLRRLPALMQSSSGKKGSDLREIIMQLITGGFGFIGAHTVRALLDLGQQCVLTQHRTSRIPDFIQGEIGSRVFIEQVDVTDTDAFMKIGKRPRRELCTRCVRPIRKHPHKHDRAGERASGSL